MGFDPVLKCPWARRLNANLLGMAGEQLAWLHTRPFNKQVVSWQEHHFNILDLYLFACLLALFEHAGTRMYLTNV